MEATIVCWGYLGIMERKMDTLSKALNRISNAALGLVSFRFSNTEQAIGHRFHNYPAIYLNLSERTVT